MVKRFEVWNIELNPTQSAFARNKAISIERMVSHSAAYSLISEWDFILVVFLSGHH